MSSASDRTAQKRGLLYSNPNSADGWPIRSTVRTNNDIMMKSWNHRIIIEFDINSNNNKMMNL